MPEILYPQDAIVKVARSCMGSDLHLYNGLVPDTRVGMTFVHEYILLSKVISEVLKKK